MSDLFDTDSAYPNFVKDGRIIRLGAAREADNARSVESG